MQEELRIYTASFMLTVCLDLRRMGVSLHQPGHGHGHHSHGEGQNASVRAAFIHVVGDLLQSVGVLVAAYIIYFKVRAQLCFFGGRVWPEWSFRM